MKFPFFFKNNKNDDLFLGLFLKEEEGVALIITREHGKLVTREKEAFKYTNGWENLTEDVDEVLYKLEKNLNIQVNKTIFFVYSHLIDERTNDIKKPFLSKIKELVKSLELTVLGYIECFEAVSFYLEKSEEIPLTAVLMELDKQQLSVFIYKGGKVNYRKSIARTDNIVEDLLSSLVGIKGRAMLPSRIILYDSGSIDEAATNIVSYRWGEDYFAQIPKIDILHEDKVIEGLVEVFSGQIKAKTPEIEEKRDLPTQEFGFVIGQDIGEVKEPGLGEQPVSSKPKLNFASYIQKMPKITIPRIDWSFLKVLKGRTGVILGLIIILTSLFLNEYFFHSAQLTVYLPSQVLKKTVTEEVSYKTASTTADFNESTPTTGKKEIGDRAKGSVNIHNFDNTERVFSKGTTLSASNLEFTLDGDVKVASSTVAADGSAKLPGKTAGSITAVNIGPESNLGKGQRFKIGDLSMDDFFAINDAALSGGSRREIRTVAKVDQDKLVNNILNKAKKDMKTPSLSNDEAVVSNLSEVELEDEKFSKEVGEEGDGLNLTAKAKVTYFSYNKKDLNKKILNGLKEDLKSGFKIEENNLNYKISSADISDDLLSMKLEVDSKAIKKFDRDGIMKKITGKSKKSLESILKSEADIQAYDVVVKESLPIFKDFLPFFKRNIFLKISSL